MSAMGTKNYREEEISVVVVCYRGLRACDYQMITTRASHSSHCYTADIKGSVNNNQPALTTTL